MKFAFPSNILWLVLVLCLGITCVLISTQLFLSPHSPPAQEDEEGIFSMIPYLEKCGGKVYAECEDQMEIWNEGLLIAKKYNRPILLIYGTDWCPPCIKFDNVLHGDLKAYNRFSKKVVPIKIYGGHFNNKSISQLQEKLGIRLYEYNTGFLVDPYTEKLISSPIYLSAFSSLKKLERDIEKKWQPSPKIKVLEPVQVLYKSYEDRIEKTDSLANVSTKLANKKIKIELLNNSITWVQTEDKKFDSYVNQGVAFLHVFNYTDALRSFKMAHKIDPRSLYPITGMIISYINISIRKGQALAGKLALDSTHLIDSASPREKLWYNLALSFLVEREPLQDTIKKVFPEIKKTSDAYTELFNFDPNDVETLILATKLTTQSDSTKQKDNYLKALKAQPLHPGANFYLALWYKSNALPQKALKKAEILVQQAPYSARAAHEYGQIFIILNRWSEAKLQFQKANAMFLNWAVRNHAKPTEEWNYGYNLAKLHLTLVGLGELKKAYQGFEDSCKNNTDKGWSCIDAHILYNVMDDLNKVRNRHIQFSKKEIRYETQLASWGLLHEIALFQGADLDALPLNDKDPKWLTNYLKILNRIIQSNEQKKLSSSKQQSNRQKLKQDIKKYIDDLFSNNSFEPWNHDTRCTTTPLRLLSVTARLKDRELYDMILAAFKQYASEFNFDLYKYFNKSDY